VAVMLHRLDFSVSGVDGVVVVDPVGAVVADKVSSLGVLEQRVYLVVLRLSMKKKHPLLPSFPARSPDSSASSLVPPSPFVKVWRSSW